MVTCKHALTFSTCCSCTEKLYLMQDSRGTPAKKPAPDYFLQTNFHILTVYHTLQAGTDEQDTQSQHGEDGLL